MDSGKDNPYISRKTEPLSFPRKISRDAAAPAPDEVLKQLSDVVEEVEQEQQKAKTDRKTTRSGKTKTRESVREDGDETARLDAKTLADTAAEAELLIDETPTRELVPIFQSDPTRVIQRNAASEMMRPVVPAEPLPDTDPDHDDHATATMQETTRKLRKYPESARLLLIAPAIALLAYFVVPMQLTAMAPAEITARRPAGIRAGRDGVVERLLVRPNQSVNKGDPLVRLDDSQQRARLTALGKMDDLLKAEYREALTAPDSRQRLPVIQFRMEQLETEKALLADQIDRSLVASPVYGMVLCDDPEEWNGRQVRLGERILDVVDPNRVELEIHLPESHSFSVVPGDSVVFYPNITSYQTMRAKITRIPHRASTVAGGRTAYVYHAEFTSESERDNIGKALLGIRGQAKVYGPRRSLALDLLQRPIATLRQWLAL